MQKRPATRAQRAAMGADGVIILNVPEPSVPFQWTLALVDQSPAASVLLFFGPCTASPGVSIIL